MKREEFFVAILKWNGSSSSLYMPVSSITSYEEAFSLVTQHERVYGTIDKRFLGQLKLYMKIHARHYESRHPIFLKRLCIYLPLDYNLSYLSKHLKEFCCESLEGLPVFAFLEREKSKIMLNILVCERYFKDSEELYIVYEDHDVYKRRKEGKNGMFFCRQNDQGAVLVARKGDIKYSFYSHFTYKSRLFAGNSKTFELFVEMLKNKWATLMLPLGIVRTQEYIKGISIKKSKPRKSNRINIYWLRNIKLYNRIKCSINDDLTRLFTILEELRLEPEHTEIWKLSMKYKYIFLMNKNIYFNRCDKVESFLNEIYTDWKKEYTEVLNNLCSNL